MKRPWVNDVLVTLAVLGVFAIVDVIGHRDAQFFWAKLTSVLALTVGCLLLTTDREALDTFFAIVAALFTLGAVAMTAGDPANPNWWPFFLVLVGGSLLCVLLTRKRRATLQAVGAIVGFRLLLFVILYAVHR